jgi:hypothetical protein
LVGQGFLVKTPKVISMAPLSNWFIVGVTAPREVGPVWIKKHKMFPTNNARDIREVVCRVEAKSMTSNFGIIFL